MEDGVHRLTAFFRQSTLGPPHTVAAFLFIDRKQEIANYIFRGTIRPDQQFNQEKDMGKGTAPAWQARDMARQKLLENIQRQLDNAELGQKHESDVLRLVMTMVPEMLVDNRMTLGAFEMFTSIPWERRKQVHDLLWSIDASIEDFKRSDDEGKALWAKVLEWSVRAFISRYHRALNTQEMLEPMLIFGTTKSTDKVPIPD